MLMKSVSGLTCGLGLLMTSTWSGLNKSKASLMVGRIIRLEEYLSEILKASGTPCWAAEPYTWVSTRFFTPKP
jgi:hypothetical protein